MSKKFTLLTFLCLLAIGSLHAQEAVSVQWASKVLEFSSEVSPVEYSAQQVLDKPNVLPNGGDAPAAWAPDRNDKDASIKVEFERPMRVQQIAIGEAYNPSAVAKVFTYDDKGTERLVGTFEPKPITRSSRMFNIFFNLTDYEVKAVKVVLNTRQIRDFVTIDCIGISDSRTPISADGSINRSVGVPVDLKPERLSDNVNSPYRELNPIISPDGNTLYFSRQFHPDNVGGKDDKEDIWYSERDPETGEWLPAKNMGPPLNTKGPDFVSSLTPDGNSVVMVLGNQYGKRGKKRAGVSFSQRQADGNWSEPVNIEIVNDINLSEKANYYLANNRQVLILSVERDDSRGGRDLYVSFKQGDSDKWSEPINIGDDLNTAGVESSPFLAADDRTLYFSSDGHSGYGGADIFVSRRLDDTWTNWTEPENLGAEINSEGDDVFFNIPLSGDYAYYSRGVQDDGDVDIFRLELPPAFAPTQVVLVKGKVYDSKTKEPVLAARVVYERLPDGKDLGEAQIDPQTGDYQIALPYGYNYGYLAEADSFMSLNANINLEKQEEYKIIEQDLYLVRLSKPVARTDRDDDPSAAPDDTLDYATISLNNVFFDFDKSNLRSESFPELDRLVSLMKKYDGMRVEVGGHTDSVGDDNYNLALSRRRAASVVTYMTKKGIPASRIKSVGYGENKPATSNDTDEERQKNRRVEFKVLDM